MNKCKSCGIDKTLEEKSPVCNIDRQYGYKVCPHISFCCECAGCSSGIMNGNVHVAHIDFVGCLCGTCAALHIKKCHKKECSICTTHQTTLLTPPDKPDLDEEGGECDDDWHEDECPSCGYEA